MQQHTFPGSRRPWSAQLGLLCLRLHFRILALPRQRQSEKLQEKGPSLGREEALSHLPTPSSAELGKQGISGTALLPANYVASEPQFPHQWVRLTVVPMTLSLKEEMR